MSATFCESKSTLTIVCFARPETIEGERTRLERTRTAGTGHHGRVEHRAANAIDAERVSAWQDARVFERAIAHGARGDLTDVFVGADGRGHGRRKRWK